MKRTNYWLKLSINLTIIGLEVLVVWLGYKLFTHQLVPVIGVVLFLVTIGVIIALIKKAGSRPFRWQRPGLFKTTLCVIAILLVCSFAGVQPFAGYKDNALRVIGGVVQDVTVVEVEEGEDWDEANSQGIDKEDRIIIPGVLVMKADDTFVDYATGKVIDTNVALEMIQRWEQDIETTGEVRGEGVPPAKGEEDYLKAVDMWGVDFGYLGIGIAVQLESTPRTEAGWYKVRLYSGKEDFGTQRIYWGNDKPKTLNWDIPINARAWAEVQRGEETKDVFQVEILFDSQPTPLAVEPVISKEQEIFLLINEARMEDGLNSLERNGILDNLAREHSRYMMQINDVNHDGFDARAEVMFQSGAMLVAENVAMGYFSAKGFVDGWLGSPGHRENIMTPSFRKTGIGIVGEYATQIFSD